MREPWILLALVAMAAGCAPSGETPPIAQFELPDGTILSSEEVTRYGDLTDEADAAYSKDHPAGCVSFYRDALAIYGGHEGNRYNLACCLARAERPQEALEELARAIDDGFAYPEHLGDDDDLASLRDRSEFASLIEKAEIAKQSRDERDPMAGDPETGGTLTTLAELEQYFADREQARSEALGDARRVLGRSAAAEMERRDRRDRIVALESFAGQQPEQAAEAGLLALQSMSEFYPSPAQLTDKVEAYLARHGDQPTTAAARMIAALGEWDRRVLQDPAEEDHAHAVSQVAATAAEIVRDLGESEHSRDAYYWLLREATLQEDHDRMGELLGTLRERWQGDEAFWNDEGYSLFAARLQVDGLEPFEVESIDGDPLNMETFAGQVTLIDFWATWCGPCIEQLPKLKEIYATYHAQGFEIVGISADDEDRMDLAAFRDWMAKNEMTWPQFYDGKGWQNEILQLYGIQGIPTTILLDRDGQVAGVDLDGEALEIRLQELL